MTMSVLHVRGEHQHHIIPRYAGGTDDPSNLVRLTIEDHAIAHMIRYKIYGDVRDKLAWKGLSGDYSKDEIRRQLVSYRYKTNNPMWDPAAKKKISDHMKRNNPNKGGATNGRAIPIRVTYNDDSIVEYDYGKQFSEQESISYPTVKALIKSGKGSKKYQIRRIEQICHN